MDNDYRSCIHCGIVLDLGVFCFVENKEDRASEEFVGTIETHYVECPNCKGEVITEEIEKREENLKHE